MRTAALTGVGQDHGRSDAIDPIAPRTVNGPTRVPEPVPPGESASDELSAGDALEAIHTALQAATQPASKHLVIGDVDFRKVGRIVLMSLSWREGKVSHHVTVRMSAAKARTLSARLAAVVGNSHD